MSSYRHALNRVIYHKKKKRKALNGPHKKGTCVKVLTQAPKKPCSARRAVAFVKLSNTKYVLCKIPGETHNLRKFSSVLVRGGRTLDVPGCKYKIIHSATGTSDLKPLYNRGDKARSKFGIKNTERKHHIRQDTAALRITRLAERAAARLKVMKAAWKEELKASTQVFPKRSKEKVPKVIAYRAKAYATNYRA